jgi:hypothetical protein
LATALSSSCGLGSIPHGPHTGTDTLVSFVSFSTYFFRFIAIGIGPYWKPIPLSRKNAWRTHVDFCGYRNKKVNSWIFTVSIALTGTKSCQRVDGKCTRRCFRLIANQFFVLWRLTVSDSLSFDGPAAPCSLAARENF